MATLLDVAADLEFSVDVQQGGIFAVAKHIGEENRWESLSVGVVGRHCIVESLP